ncbi:MAG: aldolase catalytic domain-containing protein [Clostridiales bacterium]
MENIEKIQKIGSWVSYRPDIKVVDCTIRDGGLTNNFNFSEDFLKAVYKCCLDSGVDYMEVGYKASKKIFSTSDFGPMKFSTEEDIRKIVGENDTNLKLSVMADSERTDYHNDILPKDQSVLDLIRVATYIHQIPTALDIVKDAKDKGYETSINLMSISTVPTDELDEALNLLGNSEADVIYLVDSFGSLYSEQTRSLASKYLSIANQGNKKIGIHAHNNQQLAYSNTIEALILGVSFLDATISGFGRGAGNCPMELLLGFLKNPKYHQRPVVKCIQENLIPLKESGVNWGYDMAYMLTGQLNIHPKAAIAFIESEKNKNYIDFFDKIDNGY